MHRPVPYPRWVHKPLDGGPPRIVNSHIEEQLLTGVPMEETGYPVGYVESPQLAEAYSGKPKYVPIPYPRHVKAKDTGLTTLVLNHKQESAVTGIEVDEGGKPILVPFSYEKTPDPPAKQEPVAPPATVAAEPPPAPVVDEDPLA